ncbi:uridine kinase family protein [Feifania hominis]|uniref:AAA+ ATPase domain-containing protein n=1 Tax=Feifania hominis TaxID=2763660 RepID=A0A926HQV9_9FIRM|nr:hypothetical protein [Feifania hominis]MBC8536762.1 hypothetical protein [Feifania hominis]
MDRKFTADSSHIDIGELNREARLNPAALVAQTERGYDSIVEDLAEALRLVRDDRPVIMLSGPSGSGKTTTALKTERLLDSSGCEAHVISMDNFFYEPQNAPRKPDGTQDFETVYAVDLDCFEDFFRSLLSGRETPVPRFDFTSGRRTTHRHPLRYRRGDIFIVEGIHALNPIVTGKLPGQNCSRAYICVDSDFREGEQKVLGRTDIRLMRRLIRDYKFRGSSLRRTLEMWDGVLAGEREFITPYIPEADIRFNTVFRYEPALMAGELRPLLAGELNAPDCPAKIAELHRALGRFEPLEAALVPSTSLLREFIGDSDYHEQ